VLIANFENGANPVGDGLGLGCIPTMAVGQVMKCWLNGRHRWQASSHSYFGLMANFEYTKNTVGAGLARDGGRSGDEDVG